MTNPITNPRTSVLGELIRKRCQTKNPNLLVVGCGSGIEAAVLAQDFHAKVIGVDIKPCFDAHAARYTHLICGDATALPFPDASFDVVYSYHALEHIPNPHKALDEMHRVLRDGGIWCIGTPNRARLIGYIGGGSTWREKLAWNLTDWRMRLSGRFRNEYGAHAGYTSEELRKILAKHFSEVCEIKNEYYRRLYAKRKLLISFLVGSGLGQFLFPSIYFIGKK